MGDYRALGNRQGARIRATGALRHCCNLRQDRTQPPADGGANDGYERAQRRSSRETTGHLARALARTGCGARAKAILVDAVGNRGHRATEAAPSDQLVDREQAPRNVERGPETVPPPIDEFACIEERALQVAEREGAGGVALVDSILPSLVVGCGLTERRTLAFINLIVGRHADRGDGVRHRRSIVDA